MCECLSDVVSTNYSKVCAGGMHEYVVLRVKDGQMLVESSSGGVVPWLARYFYERGYSLCGVRYNPKQARAEHFLTDLKGFALAARSKYLPSYTADAFKQLFSDQRRHFVVGTPCQIFALRRLAHINRCEDRFFFVEFWCHGVPSLHLWRSFLKSRIGRRFEDVSAFWRDKKRFGWSNGYAVILERSGKILYARSYQEGDLFSRHFLRGTCANKLCGHCPFSIKVSGADIRVGDAWGEASDNKGLSKMAILTAKGRQVWAETKSEFDVFRSCVIKTQTEVTDCGCMGPVGIERTGFLWLLKQPNGFWLAHFFHLIFCVWHRIIK